MKRLINLGEPWNAGQHTKAGQETRSGQGCVHGEIVGLWWLGQKERETEVHTCEWVGTWFVHVACGRSPSYERKRGIWIDADAEKAQSSTQPQTHFEKGCSTSRAVSNRRRLQKVTRALQRPYSNLVTVKTRAIYSSVQWDRASLRFTYFWRTPLICFPAYHFGIPIKQIIFIDHVDLNWKEKRRGQVLHGLPCSPHAVPEINWGQSKAYDWPDESNGFKIRKGWLISLSFFLDAHGFWLATQSNPIPSHPIQSKIKEKMK